MKICIFSVLLFFTCNVCAQTSDSLIVENLRNEGITFSHNNSVTLLMSGQEKFDDMFQAIRQALSKNVCGRWLFWYKFPKTKFPEYDKRH